MSGPVVTVAERIGRRAWGASAGFGLMFLGFALSDSPRAAFGACIAMVFACGVTAGAQLVARKFQ